MIKIEKQTNGYLIADKFFIPEGNETKTDKITLSLTIGEAMSYEKDHKKTINFPGNYEIEGSNIIVFDTNGSLNFFVKDEEETFAFIQNPSVLEKEEFGAIANRIYREDNIHEALLKMEFDGDKINLADIK
ncbi:MAG TPA: hypothetical protein PKD96_03865 [Candidatus Absconditabacterales bacterium]|nr:hypothetical protein [Candidatus Absconditabacterales bacterium]HMT27417.1 hypothetical protein [Candidatus Absconditabacterales bacterium]